MQTVEQRRRSNKLISNIDVVSFLSVLLVLLYIILVPGMGGGDLPHGKDVDLPYAKHPTAMPGADEDDAILIAISQDGRIWFGGDNIELPWLGVKIKERVKSGSPRVVYFKVDARAKYQTVRDALGAVGSAGIEKVAFLVEQRKTDGH